MDFDSVCKFSNIFQLGQQKDKNVYLCVSAHMGSDCIIIV